MPTTQAPAIAVLQTKLGAAKKIPRSRIWIEGERLTRAGFTHGTRVSALWLASGSLWLYPDDDLSGDAVTHHKVAGTPERPIIDITGARVRDTFPDVERVTVTFFPGRIEITR